MCRSVLVRRELCHFSVPNVCELQWCLATVAICFYFMLTHLWNLFALIPGAEHITPNPAGCWLSVVVCIPLSSSSWVNKLRELNFENNEILQCISCRVMINSHLICSGSFVGLMDEMGARKSERECNGEWTENEENLLLERFHINKKQQTRKESSIGSWLPMYHNRISFCWFPIVYGMCVCVFFRLLFASHAEFIAFAWNFIWRTRLSEANQRYKTDD